MKINGDISQYTSFLEHHLVLQRDSYLTPRCSSEVQPKMPKMVKFLSSYGNRLIISMKVIFCSSIDIRAKSWSQVDHALNIQAIFAKHNTKMARF